MDHIDDILSSDLLERYVLGKTTSEERMKVDLLKVEHKTIRQELKKLESSNATPECIIKNISGQEPSTITSTNNYKNISRLSSWWKLAAGFILGIAGTCLVMNSQPNSHNEELAEAEADMIKLEKNYEELNLQYTFINHAATTPYLLINKYSNKESKVIVYWNDDLQKSQLRVIELPSINKDQTYQLWADVDGEMQSLGVFDPTNAIVDGIEMNYLANASSLNITVEPKGGSQHPTLTTLTASVSI